jgi:hypothetical protein
VNQQFNEEGLTRAFQKMLQRPDYIFPFVSAQRQFRDHYYGLTSAALLEYFFIDMLVNYLTHHDSMRVVDLPPHGAKGWDYSVDGLKVSHKVGEDISEISGLWDATKKPVNGVMSFDDSIVYSVSQYKDKWGQLKSNNYEMKVTSLAQSQNYLNYAIKYKQRLLVAQRMGNSWTILEDRINLDSASIEASDFLPFKEIQKKYQSILSNNANDFEIFLAKPTIGNSKLANLAGELVSIEFKYLPGLYLLREDTLKDIVVTGNNRSESLIPRQTVKEKMNQAVASGLFSFMPTWFTAYSASRPPNLYLAQKQDYEKFFETVQRK